MSQERQNDTEEHVSHGEEQSTDERKLPTQTSLLEYWPAGQATHAPFKITEVPVQVRQSEDS